MPITEGVLTITPEDIKITDHLWDSFGQYETEISADWLVRFAQDRGEGWKPFTYAEIEKFYSRSEKLSGFTFNRLVSGGFIHEVPSGVVDQPASFHFTQNFIARVHKSANKL